MSVEQMAMDLRNNIEELTADLFTRYCTSSTVSETACGSDLSFCGCYGE